MSDSEEEDQIFIDDLQAQLSETRKVLAELQSQTDIALFMNKTKITQLSNKAERITKLLNIAKQEGIIPAQVKPENYRTRIIKRLLRNRK